jgi:hypothetical protein
MLTRGLVPILATPSPSGDAILDEAVGVASKWVPPPPARPSCRALLRHPPFALQPEQAPAAAPASFPFLTPLSRLSAPQDGHRRPQRPRRRGAARGALRSGPGGEAQLAAGPSCRQSPRHRRPAHSTPPPPSSPLPLSQHADYCVKIVSVNTKGTAIKPISFTGARAARLGRGRCLDPGTGWLAPGSRHGQGQGACGALQSAPVPTAFLLRRRHAAQRTPTAPPAPPTPTELQKEARRSVMGGRLSTEESDTAAAEDQQAAVWL